MTPEAMEALQARLWRGREARDPTQEEARALTVSTLEYAMGADEEAVAVGLLRLIGRTGRGLFSAAFAWASLAAVTLAKLDGVPVAPDSGGRFYVDTIPPTSRVPSDEEVASAANGAAFLAAGANGDASGAVKMWLDMSEAERADLAGNILLTAAGALTERERRGDAT